MRMRAISALVLAFALESPQVQAGDWVVIHSTDPGYASGVVLDGTQRLTIPAEKSVTLVSSTGAVIRISGPYAGAPEAGAPESGTPESSPEDERAGVTSALSQLLTRAEAKTTRLAASRGPSSSEVAGRPDLWGIDLTRKGPQCVRTDREVVLWWRAAPSGARITLSRRDDPTRRQDLRWPEGSAQVRWPPGLELEDAAYWVQPLGEEVSLLLMPEMESDAHRAAWMADQGCVDQALRVLDALREGGAL